MVLAVRGRRSYTKSELEMIFDEGFVVFFGALETLNVVSFDAAVRQHTKKIREGKRAGKRPRPFKKQTRQVTLRSAIKYIVDNEFVVSFALLTMNFIIIIHYT